MTFTDKSQHSTFWTLINTLPLSSSSSLPPSLFIHLSCFLSPIPSLRCSSTLSPVVFYHSSIHTSVHPPSHSHTSSVPPPPFAPSSATSPCLHLFPSLTLITHFLSSLRSLLAQGWRTHELNVWKNIHLFVVYMWCESKVFTYHFFFNFPVKL